MTRQELLEEALKLSHADQGWLIGNIMADSLNRAVDGMKKITEAIQEGNKDA